VRCTSARLQGAMVRRLTWAIVLVMVSPVAGLAQAAAQAAAQNVEVDPVTCWWRTTSSSIRMGESFSVVLTCSALETEAARAVIDRARLGAASVQFPPYEVITGSQSADHVTTGRRFMQYEYTLRLINEAAFGADVAVPEMAIAYRIESRAGRDAAALQGLEQTYILPPLTMRVASLVPDSARHIREASVPSLAAIASREFRARLLRILALSLFSVAGLTLLLAIARWARQNRRAVPAANRQLLTDRVVIGGVRRELSAVQQQTRAGWTPDQVRHALASTRIVASYLADQPIAQRAGATAVDGELALTGGFFLRRRVAVAGSTTAVGLAPLNGSAAVADAHDALTALTVARYGPAEQLDSGALDSAVAAAIRSADRVASKHTFVAQAIGAVQRTVRGWRPQAWAR
jgi:hypothetical protein